MMPSVVLAKIYSECDFVGINIHTAERTHIDYNIIPCNV